ncbi:MAG: site-specific DNA-methyltransferase [Flavobacteriales bacterium]|nr:site-specific DNA-methyltransferase [Flavobacteriales bacterium]
MSLSEKEKQEIIGLIKEGRTLPKEYIYKLYADEEDVFLFWNGRSEQVTNAALPFHSIEHIDEPREEVNNAPTMFDTKGRQLQGWTNKLIWGDNKLILSSLVNGPMREEIEQAGGLKLIYIDPPFAVDADFNFEIEIGGETAEKKQTVIEEIAYRDTWGKGLSSYMSMMYERLQLMHELLAKDGVLYVHLDHHVVHYAKVMLDSIFGEDNFMNTVVWQYKNKPLFSFMRYFPRDFDAILVYAKSLGSHTHVHQNVPVEKARKQNVVTWDPVLKKRISKRDDEGNIEYNFSTEKIVGSVWDIPMVNPAGGERLNYPTQKPNELLERILLSSSNEGDLIADFFGGSGTTAAVAEKLGRKWITCDLGRFGIHTTRKRMIGVQRELKKDGKDYRAFEVLNLGKYERQFFIDNLVNGARKKKEQAYLNLILQAYHAPAAESFTHLHGRKAGRLVHVGPLDVPVTKQRVLEIFEECKSKLITKVDVLGFEFEMGLVPNVLDELREQGVDMVAKYIPKDVFDPRAVAKGQVKFFDVAYLAAKAKVSKRKVTIELTDFVTRYTQDDLEEVEKQLKKGSKVVIENGNIVKLSKDKDGFVERTVLTERWQDWVDYWAIDFNFQDKKEIIREKQADGTFKEIWTGGYLFENEWQSFRTRKDPTLEYTSIEHEYAKPGKYQVMVKVIDILGVDTSQVMEVVVK